MPAESERKNAEETVEMVPLAETARVLRVPTIRDENGRGGAVLKIVTPKDIPDQGFIESTSAEVRVREKIRDVQPYVLQPYDVLFSVTGDIGRISIVPESPDGDWVPSPNFLVIRFEGEKEDQALALYAFFKHGPGRHIVRKLQEDDRIRMIPRDAFAAIRVPRLSPQVREFARRTFAGELQGG